MSPEKQRIAIAEACWLPVRYPWWRTEENEYSDYRGSGVFFCRRRFKNGGSGPFYTEPCPDYLSDLNAQFEVWKTLTDEQKFSFRSNASKISIRNPDEVSWVEEGVVKFFGEIFLRTIGKWEDS